MKKLIGSTTSPYVRRIRFMLHSIDYEFECVNVFSEEGQAVIAKYTTTGRIPLLIDEDKVIWDSLLIANHLSNEPFSIELQKDLVLINEMTDSGVQLFQLRKFNTDPKDEGVFSKNNLKRIGHVLDYFENKDLSEWSVFTQWLFCTIDWFEFREVYPWRDAHPNLAAFYHKNEQRMDVKETSPDK